MNKKFIRFLTALFVIFILILNILLYLISKKEYNKEFEMHYRYADFTAIFEVDYYDKYNDFIRIKLVDIRSMQGTCFELITISQNIKGVYEDKDAKILEEPVCGRDLKDRDISFIISLEKDKYKYPFDISQLSFKIHFYHEITYAQYVTGLGVDADYEIISNQVYRFILDDVIISQEIITSSETQEYKFLFTRPFAYKILTVVIIVTLFILMISILYIKDLNTAIQVIVGVIFSIWGTRQLIIPKDIGRVTFIDVIYMYISIFIYLIIL